jgi:DNA polymerase elongation subunit (family B)
MVAACTQVDHKGATALRRDEVTVMREAQVRLIDYIVVDGDARCLPAPCFCI